MAHHAHAHDIDHDPHGGTPHEHHITSSFTLKLILGLLLFFTILTVGQAQGEQWTIHTFGVVPPAWMNVVIVMGIATVKATLVLLYFMHLRHDNPINAIIFLFTVLGVVIFLFFTFLDIGNRGYIDQEKAAAFVKGGSGSGVEVYRPVPAYAGYNDRIKVYADLPLYLGAVETRIFDIQSKYLPKYHPGLLDARAAQLEAAPTDAVLKLVSDAKAKNKEMGVREAARRIAFDETFSKAREMAAAEVAHDFTEEFEHHIEHGKTPNAEVMKLIGERLGPAAFAKIKAIADHHEALHAVHGLGGGDSASSANFSRAKKGRTADPFDAGKVESPGHGAAH